MSRRICVVTGSRAEYGLLRRVMEGIRSADDLQLQVVVTGMHLSPQHGSTVCEIEQDGFTIDRRIEMLLDADTPSAVTKSVGVGLIGFADAMNHLRPDLLVVLGDRFELLSAVISALMFRIPVAHIHGGELTEGAVDDAIRHAITKMAHFHFVATEQYRARVIQLGESPDRVLNVGALGVDNIRHAQLLDRSELEKSLGFSLGQSFVLVTFHPATLARDSAAKQADELLAALAAFPDVRFVFTAPNADMDGRVIRERIETFVASRSSAILVESLGTSRYLSCLSLADAVVGNSSSGVIEAPALKTATVNIGERQRGRLMASSVLHCEPKRDQIEAALRVALSDSFQQALTGVSNPYGDGNAAKEIVRSIQSCDLSRIPVKKFHDIQAVGSF